MPDLTKTVKNDNFPGLHCLFWLGSHSAFSQAGLYFDLLASANGLYFCSSPLPERRTSQEPLQKHFWKRLWNGIWLVGKAVSVTTLQALRRSFLMWINREKWQREEWSWTRKKYVSSGFLQFIPALLFTYPALKLVITTGLEQQDQISAWNHPSSHA